MNPQPLTAAQTRVLSSLVAAGRLRSVPPDLVRAKNFLDQAAEALAELTNVTSPKVRYDIAYNAAHDVGEAVLAAYGYRTGSGEGQHAAVGEALRIILDVEPGATAARNYDRLRMSRNGIRYRAATVSPQDAAHCERTATDLYAAAKKRLR
jgi:hypothetical protein